MASEASWLMMKFKLYISQNMDSLLNHFSISISPEECEEEYPISIYLPKRKSLEVFVMFTGECEAKAACACKGSDESILGF